MVMAAVAPPQTITDGRIAAMDVRVTRGRHRVLDGVTLTLRAGQLVGVVGPSGGGKTTLLAALAGTVAIEQGALVTEAGLRIGVVPQDDIIHRQLPLRRTLLHAARLRLSPATDRTAAVDAVLRALDLHDHAHVPVSELSGGQRKRASIAVELLDQPTVLLLDEPTAGLDPLTAAGLVRVLRALADTGCTVVMTTHNLADLADADAVFVVDGGTVSPATDATTLMRSIFAGDCRPAAMAAIHPSVSSDEPHGRPTRLRQWLALTHRNAEALLRARTTLAVLLGVPLLVVAMFVILFRPGTFAGPSASADAQVSVAYWLAFAGFFFGLTYGLLQICTEVPVARRERFAGVRVATYLAAKAAVLLPLLVLVDATLIVVLHATSRLPEQTVGAGAQLLAILVLDSAAALTLGLLLSALVSDTAQAAMALPMVCFPAVLFAGAIVPVHDMATAGRLISVATPARWAFEAVARSLDVPIAGGAGTTPAAATLLSFTALLAIGAVAATRRRL